MNTKKQSPLPGNSQLIGRTGWKMLIQRISRTSSLSLLANLHNRIPGLGYLGLLEDIVGVYTFRETCPLIVPVDSSNWMNTADANKLILYSDKKLYDLAWKRYKQFQAIEARALWPRRSIQEMSEFLRLLIQNSFPETLWPTARAVVHCFYQLDDFAPGKSLFHGSLFDRCRAVAECLSRLNVMGKTGHIGLDFIQSRVARLIEVARTSSLPNITKQLAANFIKGKEQSFRLIIGQAKRLLPDNLRPEGDIMSASLYEILPPREAEALEAIGVCTVDDATRSQPDKLLLRRDIGRLTVKHVRQITARVAQQTEATVADLRQAIQHP
ncbi:MAG: hypothetical protein U1E51_07710 [Candidatus Binatia bacterium]|nr:hypothetical protein [Candidatus Binatia bacterium]